MPELQMAYDREGLETVVLTGTLGPIQYSRAARGGFEISYRQPFRWILGVTTPACRLDHVHGAHCTGGSYHRAPSGYVERRPVGPKLLAEDRPETQQPSDGQRNTPSTA